MVGLDMLRLGLFLGLVFHKLVWEVLKRRGRATPRSGEPSESPVKRLIKIGKGLILLFLLWQTLFLDLWPIADDAIYLRAIGIPIYLAGLGIAVLGRVQLGRNWVDLEDCRILSGQSLVTRGIYRYIRHPIYAGDILLLLGLEIALNSWLVLGVLGVIAVVARQALTEEAILSQRFPEYGAYRLRTRRFLPFIV